MADDGAVRENYFNYVCHYLRQNSPKEEVNCDEFQLVDRGTGAGPEISRWSCEGAPQPSVDQLKQYKLADVVASMEARRLRDRVNERCLPVLSDQQLTDITAYGNVKPGVIVFSDSLNIVLYYNGLIWIPFVI